MAHPCHGEEPRSPILSCRIDPRANQAPEPDDGGGMGVTRLQLLEAFALDGVGMPVDVPLGTQRLIALLALRGPAPRCVVAGTLWPDVPEKKALASLWTLVWRTNRLIPHVITITSQRLGLSPSLSVDTREQEQFAARLLRDATVDQFWLEERLEILWPAEVLPGCYDDWVIFERVRLSQLRVRALERAAWIM